ncbi:MAG: DUF4035 domain-containing protein [Chloroflexota bacterium]
MGIPIGELQLRVSSREFAEYWAYDQLEPFGPERDDLRAGVVASTIANVNRDPKRQRTPFTPDQFTLRFEPFGAGSDESPDEDEDDESFEARRSAHHAKINALMLALGGHPADPKAPPA